jgi:HlyD family secretion protein
MNKHLAFLISIILFILLGCYGNENNLEYTGTVEGTAVRVPALTPGKIMTFYVQTGEFVRKGQLLAAVDTTDLLFQRDQLTAAREELSIQRKIAGANLSRATEDYNYLQTKHDRIASLYRSESVTRQQLDDISNSLQNAGIAVSNSQQALSSIAANIKRVEAQIKSIEKKINDASITAPVEGIITDTFYEVGEAVPQFAPILEIIDIKNPEVKIYLSQGMLSQIRYGQEVRVKADGQENDMSGKIMWISPKAEFTPKTILTPDTRTSLVYAVKISVPNEDGILKHGMPVIITLD